MKILVNILLIVALTFSQKQVNIQGGSFKIGSTNSNDEQPIKEIKINSFKMLETPVTNREYNKQVIKGAVTKPHYNDGKCYIWSNQGLKKISKVPQSFQEEDKPVVCVSWYQARKYCSSIGMKLPTEAQWEYVATNGGKTKYSLGNSTPAIPKYWFKKRTTRNVSEAPKSLFQLKDMNGNVWEWVDDRYEKDAYKYMKSDNPKGPSVGRFRVIRGGGWYSSSRQLRSANRHWFAPEAPEVSIGFRCVK